MAIVVINPDSSTRAVRGGIKVDEVSVLQLPQKWRVIPVHSDNRPAVERRGIACDLDWMQIRRLLLTDCSNDRDVTDARGRCGLIVHQVARSSAVHQTVVQKRHCQKILRLVICRILPAISKPYVCVIAANLVTVRSKCHIPLCER